MRARERFSIHVVHYNNWDFAIRHFHYTSPHNGHDVFIHVGPYTIVIRW